MIKPAPALAVNVDACASPSLHLHSYLRDGQLVAKVSEWCRAAPSRSCTDRFVLPAISAVSIALSSSYVSTFVSLLLVSVVWTLCCQLPQPVFNDERPQYNGHGWLQVAADVPEIFERAFCFSLLGLSVILLTRRLLPAQPQAEQQQQPSSMAARLLRPVLHPVDWRVACCFVIVVGLLDSTLSYLLIFAPGWYDRLAVFCTPLVVLLHLVVLLYSLLLWHRLPHHPLPAAPAWHAVADADCDGDVDSAPPSPAVARPWWFWLASRWKSGVALLLMVFTYLLPTMKYLLRVGIPPNAFSMAMPLAIVSTLLWGVVCIAADRDDIRAGRGVADTGSYFIVVLTLQLCLPHHFFEGWGAWVTPVFAVCGEDVAAMLLVLVLYHVAFQCLKVFIELFSMLAVGKEHCVALVFYVQWFEDFMADLTFAFVPPFTLMFYVVAVLSLVKCVIRDCNGTRYIVNAITTRRSSLSTTSTKTRPLATEGCSGPEAAAAGWPAGSQDSGVSADSSGRGCSLWSALYSSYVASFELTLSRHQIFLSESCSKFIAVTAIICEYAGFANATAGYAPHDKALLLLAAGFCVLWVMQCVTHVLVLAILRYRQPRSVCITVIDSSSASALSPTTGIRANTVQVQCDRLLLQLQLPSAAAMEQKTASTPATLPARTVDSSDRADADCSCTSCILSFRHYIQVWARRRRAAAAVGVVSRTDSGVSVQQQQKQQQQQQQQGALAEPLRSSSRRRRPQSGWRVFLPGRLDPSVHPCVNYWLVHRCFFAIQMLHWVWFVLNDEGGHYRMCTQQVGR